MKKVKINWIHIIKEHMQKSMRLSDYHYPYAILISKFLLYFEVNHEDETSELVKSTQEENNGSLSKMGFTKINGKWVSKDGDHGGSSSSAPADFDEEDQDADMNVQNEEQPATDFDARTSAEHQGDVTPSSFHLRDTWWINLMDLWKIKEISMIFVLQISRILTTVPSRIRALTKSTSGSKST